MNFAPNTTHWNIGDEVIHDGDAKTDKMLMCVIGYTAKGLCRTRYIDPTVSGRKVFTNEIADLHDPDRPDIVEKWSDSLVQGSCLWLLELIECSRLDIVDKLVVRASSEGRARALASEQCGDEGPSVWFNSNQTTCHALRMTGTERVLVRCFIPG